MRLKLVVLPAPFGPISATVSFSLTVKLTSCTARSPPNRLLRPRMTSASAICDLRPRRLDAVAALPGFADDAHQTGRPPKDHGHQDQAVHSELHASNRTPEPALQQGRCGFQQDRADHRTPKRPDPADDGYQRRFDRNVEGERGRRVDEVDVL